MLMVLYKLVVDQTVIQNKMGDLELAPMVFILREL